MNSSRNHPVATHEIQIQDTVDLVWEVWFIGKNYGYTHNNAQNPLIILRSYITAAFALRGTMGKLWDFILTFIYRFENYMQCGL